MIFSNRNPYRLLIGLRNIYRVDDRPYYRSILPLMRQLIPAQRGHIGAANSFVSQETVSTSLQRLAFIKHGMAIIAASYAEEERPEGNTNREMISRSLVDLETLAFQLSLGRPLQ